MANGATKVILKEGAAEIINLCRHLERVRVGDTCDISDGCRVHIF
jgi:hypothetical protein